LKILVGLGNPGQTYHETRHNVGFRVIQRLAERHQVKILNRALGPDGRPASVCGDYEAGGTTVRLLMPLTMMNESGDAFHELAAPLKETLIICDDVNLPLGTLRLRPDGGSGGHHGLQSCLDRLKTEQVPRLRLGIGVEPLPKDLRDFVLSAFHPEERPLAKRMVEQAVDACEFWVHEGMAAAMNRYNKAVDT
jgi:PTH1 family peptidyl-tRNA hydrolase